MPQFLELGDLRNAWIEERLLTIPMQEEKTSCWKWNPTMLLTHVECIVGSPVNNTLTVNYELWTFFHPIVFNAAWIIKFPMSNVILH